MIRSSPINDEMVNGLDVSDLQKEWVILEKNFWSPQSRKSCQEIPLLREELVSKEPGSMLSLENKEKDHEKKEEIAKRLAGFCTRKMANF